MPARTSPNCRLDSVPTSSVSNSRSTVMIWEALATESLERPVARAGSRTLPGASAQPRLLVNGTHTIVRMRLRLSVSPWTTRTGLRKPGPEPVGSGKSAQYTWPWVITIPRFAASVLPPLRRPDQTEYRSLRTHGSSPRLRLQGRGARRTRPQLRCRPGFGTSSSAGTAAQHQRKPYQEWKSRFSYREYNQSGLRLASHADEGG